MAADLKFNIEKINGMKDYIDTTITTISAKKKTAEETLEKLKKDWNTDAGKEFKKNVDFSWTDEVDKYITVMETVSSLLEEAAKQYATVQDVVESLDFSVQEV